MGSMSVDFYQLLVRIKKVGIKKTVSGHWVFYPG